MWLPPSMKGTIKSIGAINIISMMCVYGCVFVPRYKHVTIWVGSLSQHLKSPQRKDYGFKL